MSQVPSNTTESAGSFVELWGGALRVVSGHMTDVICLRISARSPDAYANQHETGRQVFSGHPDAAFLDALPNNLFERGSEGDEVRRRHHVVAVNYSDLPFSGGKTGLIGYAYLGGHTIFLFIMDSAAKSNLPPLPGDNSGIGRNAFTEVVIGAAVALYSTGSSDLALRFAYWSRMDRDEVFASRMREVVRRNPGMTLWAGSEQVDLHSATSRLTVGVKSGESASQITTLKEATFVGRINTLRSNRWDRPEMVLPYGYRFARQPGAGGLMVPIKGVVEPDPSCQVILAALVKMAAKGLAWHEVGQRAAELKVPLRSMRYANSGKTFADLDDDRARAAAAQTLLADLEIIALWRTGSWTVRRYCPLLGVKVVRSYVLEFEPDAQNGHLDSRVTWPMPKGGWGIDDAVWDRLVERVTTAAIVARGRSGTASSATDRRPLGGMAAWVEGDYHLRLVPETPTAYRLRRRNASTGQTSDGRIRGWRTYEGEALATFHATALHNSVAAALERALVRLVEGGVELGVLEPAVRMAREAKSNRYEQAEVLEAEAQAMDAEAVTIDKLARAAMRDGHDRSAARYIEEAETDRRTAESKRASAMTLRGAVHDEPGPVEEVELDLTSPAVVVGALRRYGQRAPAELAQAIAALGITERFRVHLDDTGGLGCWEATCEVPVAGEEGAVSLHLEGTVANTRPLDGAGIGSRRSHSQDMAFKMLVEGRTLSDVAREYNRSEKLTLTRVVIWLREQGVAARSLPMAILDCPVAETRRAVFALCAGDDSLIADLERPFVDHLMTTYFTDGGWGVPTWAAAAFRFERRLMETLLAAPGCTVDKKDLADGLNVSMRQLSLRVRASGRRSALVERPQVMMMRPTACPHGDCPGPRWASHVLVTPETPGGLLCRACRRTPGDATVVFPPAYFEAWEGPHHVTPKRGMPAGGSTTKAGSPALPAVMRRGSMLTSREVAQRLGWSGYQVRTHLEPDDVVGRVRLYDSSRIDQMVLEREQESLVAGDVLSVSEAATQLGVGEHRVRMLVARGAVAQSRMGPAGVLAISASALEQLRSLLSDVDLVDSTYLSMGEAVRRAGITIVELRNAVDRGLVASDRTAGGHRRFTTAAIDAFKEMLTAADTDTSLLAIGDAAGLAGVSTGILRSAVAAGRIACVRTISGHRRFNVDEVTSYKTSLSRSQGHGGRQPRQ